MIAIGERNHKFHRAACALMRQRARETGYSLDAASMRHEMQSGLDVLYSMCDNSDGKFSLSEAEGIADRILRDYYPKMNESEDEGWQARNPIPGRVEYHPEQKRFGREWSRELKWHKHRERNAAVVRAYNDGVKVSVIKDSLGCSRQNVYRILKVHAELISHSGWLRLRPEEDRSAHVFSQYSPRTIQLLRRVRMEELLMWKKSLRPPSFPSSSVVLTSTNVGTSELRFIGARFADRMGWKRLSDEILPTRAPP